ncbi:hypothetical protein ACKI1I_28265 [Streptomyces turgidiscabies]|uniref:Uncharacterized protein n=1 Tax=Streptomyces turgidiscabies (strain Car8) TaxID=698760 RepID=L7FBV1_STRT8|nr:MULTISPECIES: hypothetical protein [Streptomyces]ELP69043.1 hypothetical protein STRTUCAR8_00336 [Streptomyces turgidiscabies Car8]MDX3498258.1 hypothetical protein [Streptomyces turgidiscabies]GAQ75231.1 hypothetical protein T45_07012 [Streptomyces turgidiscabies]
MGIFGRRKSREERTAEIVGEVASGKGFYGRATRAFLGESDFAKVQQSIGAYHSGLDVQQLLAAGAPTVPATVVSIGDTGKLVNFDPVVDLVLQPPGAADRITLQTIVSKLRIPRTGDQVLLIADPARPGAYLYAGDGVTP